MTFSQIEYVSPAQSETETTYETVVSTLDLQVAVGKKYLSVTLSNRWFFRRGHSPKIWTNLGVAPSQ